MRIQSHRDAFDTHKRALFKWALEIEGLENAQRIVGLHASRGIIELLSIMLHQKKLIDEGFQLNHRWFKSEKVAERLPAFEQKDEIIRKMVQLENLCETLAYGSPRPVQKTKEVLQLFTELESLVGRLL